MHWKRPLECQKKGALKSDTLSVSQRHLDPRPGLVSDEHQA